MTEPHFPGYEVNLKHPLYKKIDSIIENINKN